MVVALAGALLGLASVALLASPYAALAPLPAVAFLAVLVLLKRPALALYGIILLIPYGAYREIGGVGVPWLLAGFLLALFCWRSVYERRLPGIVPSALWPLLLLYVGWNVISAALSPWPSAREELFLLIAAGAFVLVAAAFLPARALSTTLPRLLIGSVSFGTLLGIVGYYLGLDAFALDNPEGAEYRAAGGAIDANNQSAMIMFVLPLAVHLALHSPSRLERWVMAGLALVNLFGVLMTMSRSGFLVCVLGVALLLIHYRHLLQPRRIGVMLAGALLAGGVMVLALPPSFFERQGSLVEWKDASLNRRASYVGVAMAAIVEHPVVGSGPNVFQELYQQSDVTRMFTAHHERRKRRAHNTYLEVLVGTGVIGLGLFLAIYYTALRDLGRAQAAFAAGGAPLTADLMACWRIGFFLLAVFLFTASDLYHKYVLLTLGVSQVALLAAGARPDAATRTAGAAGASLWRRSRGAEIP